MAYDKGFYRKYKVYLQEASVRASHDLVFEYFRRFVCPAELLVADLGCGLGEYACYGHYTDYAGIDLNHVGRVRNFVRGNYHDLSWVSRLPFVPTAFVSSFSIECFHSTRDKYALYERIFAEVPSIRFGLAGGFFYESRRDLEKVSEAGKNVSYQTIEDPGLQISEAFSEFRIHMRTPSKMFGEDVIEVWKILCRR